MTDVCLKVASLDVRRGERLALAGVSLSVAAGECVAIAGPNGGGKTTLALAVLGLIPPAAGHVCVDGHAPIAAVRRGLIGYVPQRADGTGVLPVTPRQVLRLAARRGDEAWCDHLERVALADVDVRSPLRSLSGGQRQLVLVARSLAHRPNLVLLDEPTLGLSKQAVDRLVEVLALARDACGTAAVVNTHDHLAAMRLSGRLIYLDQSVRYDGPADGVPHHLDARLCHHA